MLPCPKCKRTEPNGSCDYCDGPRRVTAEIPAVPTLLNRPPTNPGVLACPRCETQALAPRQVGEFLMHECSDCAGVWLNTESVDKVIAERTAVARKRGTTTIPPTTLVPTGKMYVRCPECKQQMQRVNYARVSGVIVDICKPHGTWFDAEELTRIGEFVSKGGMEKSAAFQREEADRTRAAQRALAHLIGNMDDE